MSGAIPYRSGLNTGCQTKYLIDLGRCANIRRTSGGVSQAQFQLVWTQGPTMATGPTEANLLRAGHCGLQWRGYRGNTVLLRAS